jgi:hypothetical protein
MLQAQLMQRRSWAGAGWAAVVAAGLFISFVSMSAGVLFMALAVLGLVAAALLPARSLSRRSAAAPVARQVALGPVAQRIVYAADGAEHVAIVVPVDGAAGYQMVLTSSGYALANQSGQIVYALKR